MSHVHPAAGLTPTCLAPALGHVVVGSLAAQRLTKNDWLLCYLYSYGPLWLVFTSYTSLSLNGIIMPEIGL